MRIQMKIDCISDLHGHFPKLEGGDLLIVAGDLTAKDKPHQYSQISSWLSALDYLKIIVIAGNHDNLLIRHDEPSYRFFNYLDPKVTYLCDSGCEYEGLKIWGSPWTSQFVGINPHCCAFTIPYGTDTEYWLGYKWNEIPRDTDILITHSPPYGIYDETDRGKLVGSQSLLIRLAEIKPLIHVFGHIHEQGGNRMKLRWRKDGRFTQVANASQVNEKYQNVHQPITLYI